MMSWRLCLRTSTDRLGQQNGRSPEVAQLMLRSRTAWPHNFDTARHHDDVPAGSSDRMASRSALHIFAAARHELKQLQLQQHA
jgi:hypothetical protein